MRRSALLAAPLALVTLPASAQDIMSGGINQSWSSTQMLLNSEKEAWAAPECIDAERWSVDCPGPRPDRKTAPADAPAAAAPADAAFRFRPSLEQRQRMFARFIAKSRAADPASGAEMAKFLEGDVVATVGKMIEPIGLRTDNIADAVALYVMEAWEISNDQVMAPDRARAQAVRQQMVRVIGAAPVITRASDADKQDFAEDMIIQAAMLSSAYATAKQTGDAAQVRAVSDAADKGARNALGMNLRTLAMTPAGLRAKR